MPVTAAAATGASFKAPQAYVNLAVFNLNPVNRQRVAAGVHTVSRPKVETEAVLPAGYTALQSRSAMQRTVLMRTEAAYCMDLPLVEEEGAFWAITKLHHHAAIFCELVERGRSIPS
ncbi:MAG TPA: hypothetical protein VGS41_07205 [Chthonomonadales bacterium]|nr:hypothetical protein [Chthonomonadales bacterium]